MGVRLSALGQSWLYDSWKLSVLVNGCWPKAERRTPIAFRSALHLMTQFPKQERPEHSPGVGLSFVSVYLRKRASSPVKNDPMPSKPSKGKMEAVCGSPLALPWL